MKIYIFLLSIFGIILLTSSEDINEPAPKAIRLVSTDMRPPESLKQDEISETEIVPPIKHTVKPPSSENAVIGKWYVQVVTHTNLDVLDNDTKKIGFNELISIQKTGPDTDPKYIVLLGPFNQGECAAMLQRMKSMGFKGSFMKKMQF